MKPFLALMLGLLTASPALALSCIAPDAVQLYERARDADEAYWIVHGRLRPLEQVAVPQPDLAQGAGEGPFADTRTQVLGRVLIGDGSFHPFARNITVRVTCTLSWCGSFPEEGTEVIAAVAVNDRDPRLTIDACGGDYVVFSEDGLDRLLDCHINGSCRGPEN